MNNRRPPGANPEKTFNRGGYYKRTGENSNGQRGYQPRDNRYQSRDERYPPRRDDKFAPKDDKSTTPREGRFQSRDNRFQTRGDKFQPRNEERFQPRDGKFPPRDGASRFARNNERSENRNDRSFPRKNFQARETKPVPPWKRIEKPRIYDEMQITDGKHIGKFLKSTDSPKVRPTARRVRETMFKLIFRRVRAGRFLDLCAGCGAVGI